MTAEKQRIAIAEACGYSASKNHGLIGGFIGRAPDGSRAWNSAGYDRGNAIIKICPDYLNDLNAMHKAEKVLTYSQVSDYVTHLRRFTPDENWTGCWGLHATAAQRAEAFLRTLNKWEDA